MKILKENCVRKKRISVKPDDCLVYIKLIGIGEKTLKQKNFSVGPILDMINGVLLVGGPQQVREKLHEVVDAACDDWLQKNGENNG